MNIETFFSTDDYVPMAKHSQLLRQGRLLDLQPLTYFTDGGLPVPKGIQYRDPHGMSQRLKEPGLETSQVCHSIIIYEYINIAPQQFSGDARGYDGRFATLQ